MDGENIEGIVELEDTLNNVRHDVTNDTGGEADNQRADGADIARSRRDGGEASDGAGGDADKRWLAMMKPLG